MPKITEKLTAHSYNALVGQYKASMLDITEVSTFIASENVPAAMRGDAVKKLEMLQATRIMLRAKLLTIVTDALSKIPDDELLTSIMTLNGESVADSFNGSREAAKQRVENNNKLKESAKLRELIANAKDGKITLADGTSISLPSIQKAAK